MSEFALLSPVYCDVIMDDNRYNVLQKSNTINDENSEAVDSLTLIGYSILVETFPSPSTSTFRRSQSDCADKKHHAVIDVLDQIKDNLKILLAILKKYCFHPLLPNVEHFKSQNPTVDISFSKFSQLRFRNCDPTSECYPDECSACPGTSALKEFITLLRTLV